MRAIFRTGAIAALAAGLLAAPVAAQTEYQGGGFLSNFTTACAPDGWTGVTQVIARMRPAGATGNSSTQNQLNLFLDQYTMHFRYNEAAVGSYQTALTFASIGGGYGSSSNPMPRIRRLATPSGTVLGADAGNAIHYIAEIDNFSHLSGCRARVNLWLYRR
jgi:hypothetical protein